MSSYILRGIDPKLWSRVKERAARDQISLRMLILQLLKGYADKTIHIQASQD